MAIHTSGPTHFAGPIYALVRSRRRARPRAAGLRLCAYGAPRLATPLCVCPRAFGLTVIGFGLTVSAGRSVSPYRDSVSPYPPPIRSHRIGFGLTVSGACSASPYIVRSHRNCCAFGLTVFGFGLTVSRPYSVSPYPGSIGPDMNGRSSVRAYVPTFMGRPICPDVHGSRHMSRRSSVRAYVPTFIYPGGTPAVARVRSGPTHIG